jgi:hypothetical protein
MVASLWSHSVIPTAMALNKVLPTKCHCNCWLNKCRSIHCHHCRCCVRCEDVEITIVNWILLGCKELLNDRQIKYHCAIAFAAATLD